MSCCEVFQVTAKIDYKEFFKEHLIPNRPCIFRSFLTSKWRSTKEWKTDNGKPNNDFLKENFGDAEVPVAQCDKKEYDSHPKTEMTFKEYINYIISCNQDDEKPCLYLKDWHFLRAFPDYKAYETPEYFMSDWMNEFWDESDDLEDDYRFVYYGPKGSWTPFHADVYRSFSWSANICGRKRWIFYQPGQEEFLKDRFGKLPFDVLSNELKDRAKFPNADKATDYIEIIQETSDTIFVPSGWHHQVYNLEDTISINHNWINGSNVSSSWDYIKSCLIDVEKEIADCRDSMTEEEYAKQCQLILMASSGINYDMFFRFIFKIASNRINSFQGIKNLHSIVINESLDLSCKKCGSNIDIEPVFGEQTSTEMTLGMIHHALFDLKSILNVAENMSNIAYFKFYFNIDIVLKLIKNINEIIETG